MESILNVLNTIEKHAENLGLKDPYGDPLMGVEAIAVVSRHFGDRWSQAETAFEQGRILPDKYLHETLLMIREFRDYRLARRAQDVAENLW